MSRSNEAALTAPPTAVPHQHRWESLDEGISPRTNYTQGSLALTFPLPSGLDSVPHSRALTVVQPPVEDPTAPTAESWAARFLQAVVEVMSSDRPLTQLIRWTDEDVYAEIGRRQTLVSARRQHTAVRCGRQQVATVHVCQLSHACAEVAARVTNGRRSRALAARLDLRRGRWVCTAIQFE